MVSDGRGIHVYSPTFVTSFTPTSCPSPYLPLSSTATSSFPRSAIKSSFLTPTPVASLTPIFIPDEQVLFENAFEVYSEQMILEAGWQKQVDENGNHFLCNLEQSKPSLQIQIGETDWKDYRLDFEVKQIEFVKISEMLSVLVRVNGETYYHFLVYFTSIPNAPPSIEIGSGYVSFGKRMNTYDYQQLPGGYFERPVENQWYRIHIEVDKGEISFYWNDVLVLKHHDQEYLTAGVIQIFTDDGTCLDNLKATTIND